MKKRQELGMADLESCIFAMESWLDAFEDDDVFEEDVPRVKRGLEAFRQIAQRLRETEEREPHLRLVKPDKDPKNIN